MRISAIKEKTDTNYLKAVLNQNLEFIPSVILFCIGAVFKVLNFSFSYVFFVSSVLVCGFSIFVSGTHSALKFKFSEKTLITIASIGSIFINGPIESLLILILFRISESLEKIAKSKSKKDINNISKIMPDTAHLLLNGTEKKVMAKELKIGDIFIVYPFEKIPCDGTIIEGKTYLTLSAITGESLPVLANVGSKVLSGSINTSSTIKVRTDNIAKESTAGKILNLIENGIKNKAKTETFINKFSHRYTLTIILFSIIIFFVLLFILGVNNFNTVLKRSLTFMVTSCPCSIVISVPLAFFYGIGKSANLKILFKGSKYLESLSKISTIFLDKTGTLTKGTLEVEKIYSFDEKFRESDVLNICANVEFYSAHPIARALIKKAKLKKTSGVKNIKEIPGYGVKALMNDEEILCGKLKLLRENDIVLDSAVPDNLMLYLAIDGKVVGGVNFCDSLREKSKETIKKLKTMGIKSIVLSGDKKETTKKISHNCGISEFYSDLMPEDKLNILNKFKKNNSVTAFIGDGINDAPTLAAADCGIAMGIGNSATVEAAGVVLLNGDISLLPKAVEISRKIMKTIKSNIYFALFVKLLVLFRAAFFYVPTYLAIFADVGVTLISIRSVLRTKF